MGKTTRIVLVTASELLPQAIILLGLPWNYTIDCLVTLKALVVRLRRQVSLLLWWYDWRSCLSIMSKAISSEASRGAGTALITS